MNPHSFIIFKQNKDVLLGKDVRLASRPSGEPDGPRSWTRTMLSVSDRITIIGPQNKNGSADLNLFRTSKITMPIAARFTTASRRNKGKKCRLHTVSTAAELMRIFCCHPEGQVVAERDPLLDETPV